MIQIPIADKRDLDDLTNDVEMIKRFLENVPASKGGIWCGAANGEEDDFLLLTGSNLIELAAGDKFTFFTDRVSENPLVKVDDCLGYPLTEKIKKPGIFTLVFYDDSFFMSSGAAGEYGTADAAQVLEGYTIGTDEGLVAGTIQNRGGINFNPGEGQMDAPAGYYDGITVRAVENLAAANVKSGVNLGGVVGSFSSDATATAADILNAQTAYVKGTLIMGNMPNHGLLNLAPNNMNINVPSGYYSGGTISAVANLDAVNIRQGITVGGIAGIFTNDATANAAQILSGSNAYVKGALITGSMINRGAPNLIPNNAAQPLAIGYYSGGTISAVANLAAANIRQGSTVGGVAGNFTNDADAVAGDILSGKKAYVKGALVTGNLSGSQGMFLQIQRVQVTVPLFSTFDTNGNIQRISVSVSNPQNTFVAVSEVSRGSAYSLRYHSAIFYWDSSTSQIVVRCNQNDMSAYNCSVMVYTLNPAIASIAYATTVTNARNSNATIALNYPAGCTDNNTLLFLGGWTNTEAFASGRARVSSLDIYNNGTNINLIFDDAVRASGITQVVIVKMNNL